MLFFVKGLLDADLISLIGSTVQLMCPYTKTSSQSVRWYKLVGETPLLYTENLYINKDTLSSELYNRLSVSGNHDAGEYHLNIANIRKSDEGRYECIVSPNTKRLTLTAISK